MKASADKQPCRRWQSCSRTMSWCSRTSTSPTPASSTSTCKAWSMRAPSQVKKAFEDCQPQSRHNVAQLSLSVPMHVAGTTTVLPNSESVSTKRATEDPSVGGPVLQPLSSSKDPEPTPAAGASVLNGSHKPTGDSPLTSVGDGWAEAARVCSILCWDLPHALQPTLSTLSSLLSRCVTCRLPEGRGGGSPWGWRRGGGFDCCRGALASSCC